ncbi:restriction endonuclease subunit S [Flavobacterium psychrophilum]
MELVATMTTYAKYKKSRESWLGEIPEHWVEKKFKHIFSEKKKTTNVDLPCGSISFGKVVYKDDEKIPESTKRSYQVLSNGDFLINPLNLNYDLVSLRIALSDKDVVVSSGYIILNNNLKLNKDYYKWLLHIFDVVYMKTLGSGVRQTLSFTHIANSELVFPPIEEQNKMANFLETKTIKIDQAIAIKQKQIELLKERRQILIHKAVTKGLNDTIKFKDSNVEWIGEIPKHWEVKRLKDICSINLNSLPENTNINFELKYVDIGSVNLENGINNVEEYTFKNAPSRARRIAEKGDTIISTVRTYLKAIDFVDELKSTYVYSTGFAVLHPKEFIYPEFLGNFVRSDAFTEQVTVNSKGMSYPAINSTDIGRLTVVHCGFEEQKQIVAFIENTTSKIATAISLKEQEIEKLKEYKTSLVNSVITGKVKV